MRALRQGGIPRTQVDIQQTTTLPKMSLIAPSIIEKHPKAFIIGGLVLILVIIGLILWAYSGNRTETERQLDTNIGRSEGQNGVVTNLVTNQQGVVNNATNITNNAVNELNNSLQRDSNSFTGNSSEQFCRRFQCDTTCGEWRKSHPEVICR